MKTLSEVCKLVGVSRQRLQRYNEDGLLKPTAKTSGGYWLYDDEAIENLIGIQSFIECGYRPKEIKKLINDETQDVGELYDETISSLLEKRDRLDGLIEYMQTARDLLRSPVIKRFENLEAIDPADTWKNNSFLNQLNEFGSSLSKVSAPGSLDRKYILFYSRAMIFIALYNGCPFDSHELNSCLDKLTTDYQQIAMENERNRGVTKKIAAEVIYETLNEALSDSQEANKLDSIFGVGAKEFILEATKAYAQKLTMEEKEAL